MVARFRRQAEGRGVNAEAGLKNDAEGGAAAAGRSERFALNVFWNWLGVGVSLCAGLLLSPYLIRRLGPDGYGVWALSFSMVEYYWLLDLGFRAAVVKYVAHYWTTGENDKIAEVINTGLFYSAAVAGVIMLVIGLAAFHLDRFFQVAPAFRGQFPILIVLISTSWCLGSIFNIFGGCLDAVQRFDLSTRASIVSTAVRTFGTAAVLYFSRSLIAIGLMTAFSQIVMYVLNYLMFRRLFRGQSISFRHASRSMLRTMGGFGIHAFLTNIGNQISTQSPPVLIGHYQPARFVGYYNLPVKLLQYTVELVARTGLVTNSNAAELAARNDRTALSRLAVFPNRYCLVMFMPMAVFLAIFGDQLFQLWVGAAFAAQSAPILPVLLAGSVIAHVGQFSSTMLLQGLARNQQYARGLLAEALIGIVLMIWAIPRYGILGGAVAASVLMILNRAVYVSWLTSRVVRMPFWSYVTEIYFYPFAAAVPAVLLLWWIRSSVFTQAGWLSLATAGLIAGLSYYPVAWFTCLAPQDRLMARGILTSRLAARFS